MRYAATIALFLIFALSMPLQAQRGGGHASAAGHGGFSGHSSFSGHAFSSGRSGSSFASHSFARSRSSVGPSSFSRPPLARSFSATLSSRRYTVRSFNRSTGLRIRTYNFRNNCFGYPCRWGYGYPYLGGGVDPYWWWDTDSTYNDDDDQQNQIGLANEMNAQSIDQQRMRQQGDEDLYARQAPTPARQAERTEPVPSTVLVFRDQHTQEIKNYAIVGQTLVTFAPQHSERIPLADLDLSATAQANDDRGVLFRLPTGSM